MFFNPVTDNNIENSPVFALALTTDAEFEFTKLSNQKLAKS